MKALVKMEPGAGNWQIIDKPEPTINKRSPLLNSNDFLLVQPINSIKPKTK